MVTKKRGLSPRTLAEAHELLGHMRPSLSAAPATWLKYYRRSAAVYAEVAEIDRGHYHEATHWANRERARANQIAAEIAKTPPPSTGNESGQAGKTVHTEQ